MSAQVGYLESGIKLEQAIIKKGVFMKKIFFVLLFVLVIAQVSYSAVITGNKKKILCLGDSLTYGTGDSVGNTMGYRDHLLDDLGSTGWQFIGTSLYPHHATGYETNHSGYASLAASQTVNYVSNELSYAFGNSVPDGSVVILYIGTNDIARSVANGTVTGYITSILDSIRTFNTNIKVIIPNLGPNGTGAVETRMVSYNTALATALATYQSTYPNFNIVLVDMHAAIANDTPGLCGGVGNWQANCYFDTTHFNDTGYREFGKQILSCMNSATATNCSL